MKYLFGGLFCLLCLCSGVVGQEYVQVQGEKALWSMSVSTVVSHKILVQREREINVCDEGDCIDRISDLRVSSIVLDNGPSTDVSPRYSLYLTMHNSITEHAVAVSLHRLASFNELISAERVEAGIYEFVYKAYNLEYSSENKDRNCDLLTFKIRVDAKELSTLVRQAKKTKFFEDAVYQDPIFVLRENLGCL